MGRRKTNFGCSVDGCASRAVSRGWCSKHYSRWLKYGAINAKKTAGTGEPLAFLKSAAAMQADDCIAWPFAMSPKSGYGVFQIGGSTTPAHRMQCTLVYGQPPTSEHQAAHLCGNRICVNPRHIRWSTRLENAADQIIHGTRNRGERQGSAKLTRDQVKEIRRLKTEGISGNKIARMMGLSRSHVNRLANGQSWSWL